MRISNSEKTPKMDISDDSTHDRHKGLLEECDNLGVLPPPILPLSTSRYLSTGSNENKADIPLYSWVRMQQKKFVKLNRKRAAIIQDVPCSSKTIPVSHLNDMDALAAVVLTLLHELMPEWKCITSPQQLQIERLGGAMTNSMFIITPLLPATPSASSSQSTESEGEMPKKTLLRIYGAGSEQFFNRNREIFILQVLSCMKVGPRLLGMFENGRFEEYIDSIALRCNDLSNNELSMAIADKLFGIHSLVGIIPALDINVDSNKRMVDTKSGLFKQEYESELWNRIDNWIDKAAVAVNKLLSTPEKHQNHFDALQAMDFDRMRKEMKEWRKQVKTLDSPVVFTHNDIQYGNILKRKTGQNDVILIDFEYAGYNYRGFDIANHFCEWAADYHSDNPHLLDFSKMPTTEQQMAFFDSYLTSRDEFIQTRYNYRRSSFSSIPAVTREQIRYINSLNPPNPHDSLSHQPIPVHPIISPRIGPRFPGTVPGPSPSLSPGPSPSLSPMLTPQFLKTFRSQEMNHLLDEVNTFIPLSHIMWGLWGLIQAQQSVIDFDYLAYAIQRITEYDKMKGSFITVIE